MEILKAAISWIHVVSASLSLIIGPLIFFKNKGTKQHKKIGRWYFYLMLVNNITALLIYNAFGKFFFPHWLAVATLIVIILGFAMTRFKSFKHWMSFHLTCMIVSYYMLIGGAINEMFLHIPSLRPLLFNNSFVVGVCHLFAMIFFIGLLIFYLTKYKRNKLTGNRTIAWKK